MPVGNDEYLRRSIRSLRKGIAGLQQRWAIARALQRQLATVSELAAKYGVTEEELATPTSWKLSMVRSATSRLDFSHRLAREQATTATGGEGVARDGCSLNLNQSVPDSNNSQSLPSPAKDCLDRPLAGWVGAYMGPNPEENDIRVLAEAEKLKVPLEWPVEAAIRIAGLCPNPRLVKGVLGDGRGVSVLSAGMGNVRIGSVVVGRLEPGSVGNPIYRCVR